MPYTDMYNVRIFNTESGQDKLKVVELYMKTWTWYYKV